MDGIKNDYAAFVQSEGYTMTSEAMPPRDTPLECVYIDSESHSVRTTHATLGLAENSTSCNDCGVTEALISGSSTFVSSLAWRIGTPVDKGQPGR